MISDFTDDFIYSVIGGNVSLELKQREYLADYTYRFEECDCSIEQLLSLDDSRLMEKCYSVWKEYCSSMF